MKMNEEDMKRFSACVDTSGNCWLWTASTNQKGYGHIYIGDKLYASHRVSWEIYNGPIPAGQHVLHRCDNPGCVNPEHLYLGTDTDNQVDRLLKGRGQSPLTPNEVRGIKGALKYTKLSQAKLAQMFGVQSATISRIATGKRWACIKLEPKGGGVA